MKSLMIVLSFLCIVLAQCSSSNKVQEATPMKLESQTKIIIDQPYFQKWAAGMEEGGTGINIYFPNLINKNNYVIDKVYFRGMIGKIQRGKASYFASLSKNNKDIIMTNDPKGEYGNTLPNNPESFPFKLKENQCVISYIDNGKTKSIQINNIVEKEALYYPSAPPKQNKE